jgi:hypothetical protein
MNDLKQQNDTDGSRSVIGRRFLVAGLLVGAVTVVAVVAIASRRSNPEPEVPVGDQQIASTWAHENPQMWSWMQSHWDEMTLMHQHWGDAPWMQENLSDYAWMQDHWNDMVWMHDHWSGMMWMHTQGMMGSASGGMMG